MRITATMLREFRGGLLKEGTLCLVPQSGIWKGTSGKGEDAGRGNHLNRCREVGNYSVYTGNS